MKQELKTLIEEQRKKSFIDQSKATDEEALGILISTYMEWEFDKPDKDPMALKSCYIKPDSFELLGGKNGNL